MRQMVGADPSFRDNQHEGVWCPECKMKLVAGFLEDHNQAQHRKECPPQWVTPLAAPDPIYRVYLSRASGSIGCTVGRCEGQATMRTNLCIKFYHHHVRDMVVIMEEGNCPHTR